MKILWSSNAPFAKTGYGQQTNLFLPRLKALGHEMAAMAWYGLEGGLLHWNDIPIYPKRNHPYGEDAVSAHAVHHQADVVITLIDAWVCEPSLHNKMRWVPWFPVDSEPLAKPIRDKVAQSYQPIVYSKFGIEQCEKAGISPAYVPHGVDSKIFKPGDQKAGREFFRIPADVFVVGMVAANKDNPSRKAFVENLTAFAHFHKRHPDTVLYLHTHPNESGRETMGINLPYLINSLGLTVGKNVFFTDAYAYYMGLADSQMASLYNAFDVLLSVSMGEGFGVPLLEAQACGTPVILGDWTAMPELLFGGWKVNKKEAAPFMTGLGVYQYLPFIDAIDERLEAAYLNRTDLTSVCVAGASQYDADLVTEQYWKPVLEQIEQRVETNKRLFKAAESDHKHKWSVTGLWIDGRLCQPCLIGKCECGLANNSEVVPGLFPSRIGDVEMDIEDDPEGGVSKFVMYECLHSYKLDALDLKPGELVIDIGAHVGIVSIYLALKYGVRVRAYEPMKENYERLVRNARTNGVGDLVIPFNAAVTLDGRDVVMPNGLGNNSGGNNIYQMDDGCQSQSIPFKKVMSGDAPALVKIDCEGAEYEILEGHYDLLKGVRYAIGELHFNNHFTTERLRRLMFEVQRVVGVDNVNFTTTPIGDL